MRDTADTHLVGHFRAQIPAENAEVVCTQVSLGVSLPARLPLTSHPRSPTPLPSPTYFQATRSASDPPTSGRARRG